MKAIEPGRLSLRLSSAMTFASVTHIESCPDIGPACNGPAPPAPYWHHVELFVAEIPLEASYGLLPWLAAELRFPLRVVDVRPTFRGQGGGELAIDDIHHRRETLFGPADPWLALRVAGRSAGWSAGARLGATLPLGKTQPDPFELAARGQEHEHIQFGSGTIVPVIGGAVAYAWPRVELGAAALGLFSLYENHFGYRAPTRLFGAVRLTVPFLGGDLRPFVSVDLSHESNELWHGAIGGEGPTERTDLLAGGGVSWRFRDPWAADFGFRARVAKLGGGATLDYPGVVELGLTTAFDLPRPQSSN